MTLTESDVFYCLLMFPQLHELTVTITGLPMLDRRSLLCATSLQHLAITLVVDDGQLIRNEDICLHFIAVFSVLESLSITVRNPMGLILLPKHPTLSRFSLSLLFASNGHRNRINHYLNRVADNLPGLVDLELHMGHLAMTFVDDFKAYVRGRDFTTVCQTLGRGCLQLQNLTITTKDTISWSYLTEVTTKDTISWSYLTEEINLVFRNDLKAAIPSLRSGRLPTHQIYYYSSLSSK